MKKKVRILLVEDEMLVAMSLTEVLREMGYEVCGNAANGENAISLIEKEKPDLVIMDIRLSGKMDGIEIAEKIRAFSDCPIIFTTGYDSQSIRKRINDIIYTYYLTKPIILGELFSILESLFNS